MERLKFKPENIKIVKAEEIRPNTWNPKEKDTPEYQKIKKGIELKGLRLPVVVRENNGYEIIDGEQRYNACKELGMENIVIYSEGVVSDKEAQELTVWYQQQVPMVELELATLLKNLAKDYGIDNLELPYDDVELDKMIKLVDFDWDSLENKANNVSEKDDVCRIELTQEQYIIVLSAIDSVKDEHNDLQMSNGRCLELICADFLAGREQEDVLSTEENRDSGLSQAEPVV